jgi:membrane protein implicated in regulation of membrane protease activity
MIAVFALWGLGASGLVGTTEDKVFRLSDMLYQSLFWLLVGEWISFIVYVFFTSTDFVLAISTMILLFTRSLFLFAPSAIITAYFYTRFLESRAEAKIVAYLSKKERLVEKVLTISADKKRESTL